MTQKFDVGMLVKFTDPAKAGIGVGKVLIAYDYNGDIHVEFPDPQGIGIWPPEELEIVETDGPTDT